MSGERTFTEIEEWLISHLQRCCGVSQSSLSPTSCFRELGLDSVEVTALAGDLEGWLGSRLSPTLLAEFPSIGELAGHLSGQRSAASVDRAKTTEPAEHDFERCVNPYLGALLRRLNLDKEFVRGSGCDLWDAEGRHYLDFVAGYGALPFGHNPPEIWAALQAVADSQFPGFAQPSLLGGAGQLAKRLLSLVGPSFRYVTFASSGAEAIEAAIKLCRASTGRLGILSTIGGFHGKTLGALSATGNPKYQTGFGAPAPFFHAIPYGDAHALRDALRERPGYYAAFVVEPIQGEGGVVEADANYWTEARRICREAGVLVVADEVQTGLGRTGVLFASLADGLQPDVIALAKALGGGLVPIGACIASEAAYCEDFALKHSSTFAGGALACAAGLASLDLLLGDDASLLRAVRDNGARMKAALHELGRQYPRIVAEVRGRGYLLGLRLRVNRTTWQSNVLGLSAQHGGFAPIFASYLLNVGGVRVAPTLNNGDVLRIEPSLRTTWKQCESLIESIAHALSVFDSGDSGRVLGEIVDPSRRTSMAPIARAAAIPKPTVRRDGDGHFAFVLHPLDLQSYVQFDPTLGALEGDTLERAVRIIHGLGNATLVKELRVSGVGGRSAYGEFVLVGHTAQELTRMPRGEAVRAVRDAVNLARDRGARIVGLGAYTSVVTEGGLAVADAGVAITTGNTFTTVAAISAIQQTLRDYRRFRKQPVTAIVGAAGAIGRVLSALMAGESSRLILIGNRRREAAHNRSRLLDVAADVCCYIVRAAARGTVFKAGTVAANALSLGLPASPSAPHSEFLAAACRLEQLGVFLIAQGIDGVLPLAEVVLLATSSTTDFVTRSHLRRNAVVCDISRPRNVSARVQETRPDVLIVDGGVIEVPGNPDLGIDLDSGLAYACMAETMMLALEQRYAHMGLGTSIEVENALWMRELASTHGFKVVLRSFGRPLAHPIAAPLAAAAASMDGPPPSSRRRLASVTEAP